MRVRCVDANFDWFGGSTGSALATRGLLRMEIISCVNASYASRSQDRESSKFRATSDETPTHDGVTTSVNTKADRLVVGSAYLPSRTGAIPARGGRAFFEPLESWLDIVDRGLAQPQPLP